MASPRSWVTSTAVVRSSRRMRPRSSIRPSRVGGSSEENGSSSSRTSGSITSARASAARCASPPDSVRARRSARCAMPKRSSHSPTRSPRPGRARRESEGPGPRSLPTDVSARSASWKTLAIRRRTASPARGATAVPRKRTSPADGDSSRPRTRRSVDLPAPFGPMRARTSPGGTASAGTSSTVRPPRATRTPRTSSTGGVTTEARGSSPDARRAPTWRSRAMSRISYTMRGTSISRSKSP